MGIKVWSMLQVNDFFKDMSRPTLKGKPSYFSEWSHSKAGLRAPGNLQKLGDKDSVGCSDKHFIGSILRPLDCNKIASSHLWQLWAETQSSMNPWVTKMFGFPLNANQDLDQFAEAHFRFFSLCSKPSHISYLIYLIFLIYLTCLVSSGSLLQNCGEKKN